jgi:hypothetical protein
MISGRRLLGTVGGAALGLAARGAVAAGEGARLQRERHEMGANEAGRALGDWVGDDPAGRRQGIGQFLGDLLGGGPGWIRVTREAGQLRLAKSRPLYAAKLAGVLLFCGLWYCVLAATLYLTHAFMVPLLLRTAMALLRGVPVSPSPLITAPALFYAVIVTLLLAPLRGVWGFCRLTRIVLAGEVFTLDREANALLRNGRRIVPLDRVTEVRVEQRQHPGGEGADPYTTCRLSLRLHGGRATVLGEWRDGAWVSNLAGEVAGYLGARRTFVPAA